MSLSAVIRKSIPPFTSLTTLLPMMNSGAYANIIVNLNAREEKVVVRGLVKREN